jgi:hypothetical protein
LAPLVKQDAECPALVAGRFRGADRLYRGRENVHKRSLIHVAGHDLGLLMRLLIGAETPKEAVARGWCLLVLLPTAYGTAYEAMIMVLVAHSTMQALIVFSMGLDHRPD